MNRLLNDTPARIRRARVQDSLKRVRDSVANLEDAESSLHRASLPHLAAIVRNQKDNALDALAHVQAEYAAILDEMLKAEGVTIRNVRPEVWYVTCLGKHLGTIFETDRGGHGMFAAGVGTKRRYFDTLVEAQMAIVLKEAE